MVVLIISVNSLFVNGAIMNTRELIFVDTGGRLGVYQDMANCMFILNKS